MATFPAYARILATGYAEQRESALLRTEMESGPAKQAKVKSRVMVTRPVKVLVSSVQEYRNFLSWYSVSIGEGSAWFDFTDPVTGTVKQARFVGGGIEASPVGAINEAWMITAKIETWG